MIATSISGSWFGGYLAADPAFRQAGIWRAADLPGGAFAYTGGTYYGIPKHSRNKEMAWEFVKFMTLDKSTQLNAFKLQNVFPALLEAQIDPFFDQPLDFLGGQKARLMWRDAARRIPSIRVNQYDSLAFDILDEELGKVLDAGKDIPTALKDAKAAIEAKIASEARQP
jgi:multiple sugar transport system substrate-binding protein